MLWFYLSSLAILIGAEMNAEIEQASPHGKAPGEKVPGERRKIGAAAARAFAEQQDTRQTESPSPAPVVGSPAGSPVTVASVAAYAVLAVGLWRQLRRKS